MLSLSSTRYTCNITFRLLTRMLSVSHSIFFVTCVSVSHLQLCLTTVFCQWTISVHAQRHRPAAVRVGRCFSSGPLVWITEEARPTFPRFSHVLSQDFHALYCLIGLTFTPSGRYLSTFSCPTKSRTVITASALVHTGLLYLLFLPFHAATRTFTIR